jgi:hypothetical protein
MQIKKLHSGNKIERKIHLTRACYYLKIKMKYLVFVTHATQYELGIVASHSCTVNHYSTAISKGQKLM